MKKLSKFIYFIFAFALITCMAIFNPTISFVSAEEQDGVTTTLTISTEKIKSSIDATNPEDKLLIPTPNVAKGDKYIVVKDRSGSTYTYDCATGVTKNQKGQTIDNYFTLYESKTTTTTDAAKVKYIQPANIGKGTYTIQYKVVDDTKTYYTEAQTVQVTGAAYSWEFAAENKAKDIIPSITKTDAKFYLPMPTIVNNTDESKSYTFKPTDVGSKIIITKGGVPVTSDVTEEVVVKEEVDGQMVDVTKVAYSFEQEGTYIIRYKSTETAFADRSFTIKVTNNYAPKAELKVTHNSFSSVQVGAEMTFPTANVTDKTHNTTNVEVNNTIIIKKGSEVVTKLAPNQYTYTFTSSGTYTIYYEATDAYGNSATSSAYSVQVSNNPPYLVTYAEDYQVVETDNGDGTKTTTVGDKVVVSGNEVVSSTEVITNADYLVRCEAGYGGFWLPAIYAEDYVTSYEDMAGMKNDSGDLVGLRREIEMSTDSSIKFNVDVSAKDSKNGNAALAQGAKGKYNEKIFFQFPEMADTENYTSDEERIAAIKEKYAGKTFKVKYSAKGAGDTYAYATIYTITIADVDTLTYNVDKNMMVNFATINDSIDPDAELSFAAATAKEEPKDDELVADERIEVRTYYYYGSKSLIEDALYGTDTKPGYIAKVAKDYADAGNTDKYIDKYGYQFDTFLTNIAQYGDKVDLGVKELKTVDGKTSIKLDKDEYDALSAEKKAQVTIFTVGINDQEQFVIKAQEVAIKNTNDDKAPVVKNVNNYIYNDEDKGDYTTQLDYATTGVTKFNQNCEVYLKGVSFIDTDATDKSLEVEVKCYVDTPDQTVGVTIDEFIQEATGECGIKAARLTTTYAGTYYVVYTATDDAGNKATYVSTFEVANTEKAYIKVENGSNITRNVGEEVKFNIDLVGNGEYTDIEYTIEWGESKPSGLGSSTNSYKFNKAGTYVATISATYTLNGKTITADPSVTVTVTVTEPQLTWADDINEVLSNRTADLNEKVYLDYISAEENGVTINCEIPKVVYTNADGKEEEVEVVEDETQYNGYYFVAAKDGVYKVTYTATTNYNSSSKSFTVTCGDYYDPTVTIASNKLQDSKITYNGTDLTFKVDSFKLKNSSEAGRYVLKVYAYEGDNKDEKIFSYDIDVTLSDVNADKDSVMFNPSSENYSFELTGDSVSGSGKTWTISGVGTYELKLKVKDANGNYDTKTISFKVVNKTEPKKVNDNVVGIVLIIVSAVILGGVILFFALAGKRNKTRRSSIKAAKKD